MGSLCYLCLGVLALTWSVSSQPQLVAYPNYQPNSGSNPFPLGPVCDDELDLVIAFDGSNSMYERDFTLQKNAIINLVNNLNIGPLDVHVGLVLFSTDVYSHPLSGNKQQIIADINALEYPDDLTRTDLAIQRATELFRRNSRGGLVRKILVIVTDGRSNKPDLTIQEADIAKALGISISVIGVTDAIYQPELDAIASSPQQVFSSATFQNLQREILHAVYRSCQIVTTRPPPPPVTTRPPPPVRTTCNDQLDLVIAFDGSNSMYEKDFNTQKNAIITLVNNLNIGPQDVHVGLVMFSTNVYSHPLNGNKQQIISDIMAFQFPDDITRTDLAIQEASNLFRNAARGGNVRRILIIVTDGRSTEPQLTIQAADIAKNSGISISMVGVTDAIYRPELDAVASSPQQVFFSNTFGSLQNEILFAVYRSCLIVTTPAPPPTRRLCNDQLDMVIAIDGSNSMFERNFNIQKNALIKLMHQINISPYDVHVGLVLFSTDVTSHSLSGNKQQIIADINAFEYPDGMTRTDLAIERASELFRAARNGDVRKVLLIVTDGRANYAQRALQEADNIKASGVIIYVIGVGDAINREQLTALASSPRNVIFTDNYEGLQQTLVKATTQACSIVPVGK